MPDRREQERIRRRALIAADGLTRLSALRLMVEEMDRQTADAVRLARSQGKNWGEIGKALGMSRQGARQRFAHLIEPEETE